MSGTAANDARNTPGSPDAPGPAVAAPQLPDERHRFARLADVRCPVEVVLGSGTIAVRTCLGLNPDSVIRLGQPAGEDLQVRVGGVIVARAEVVVADDHTALRVTEIAPASHDDEP